MSYFYEHHKPCAFLTDFVDNFVAKWEELRRSP
jgi:hypothetical protein